MSNNVFLYLGLIDVAVAAIVIELANSKGMEILVFPPLIFIANIVLCGIFFLLHSKIFAKAFGINTFIAPLLFILIDISTLEFENNQKYKYYYLSFQKVRYELCIYRERKQFCLRYSPNSKVLSGKIEQREDILFLILDWKNNKNYNCITDSLSIGDSLFISTDSLYGLKDYPIELR